MMEDKQAKEAAILAMCNVLAGVERRLRSVRFHLDAAHTGKGVTTEDQRESARRLTYAMLADLDAHIDSDLQAASCGPLLKAREEARCL